MDASALLKEFTSAVEHHDGKRFASLFAEDGVYHDVFYGAFKGREKIAEMIDDCAALLTHRFALITIRHGAQVRQKIVRDVDQIAIARLPKHVAPIVSVRPELRILEREIDAPDDGEAKEVSRSDDRRQHDHAVHEQIGREFAAESGHLRRFPAPPFLWCRRSRRWRRCGGR